MGAFHSTQNSGNYRWYIKWNGPFRFGPTEIFGTSFEGDPLWPVWSFRSVGRSDRNVPFHLTKLLFPLPLSCILLTRTRTKRAVTWVGSVQLECTIHWARGISEISNRNFCWIESALGLFWGSNFDPVFRTTSKWPIKKRELTPTIVVPYSNSAPHRSIVTCNLKMAVNCSCWYEFTLIIFCPYPELCGTRCAQARGHSRSLFPKRLSGKSEKALNNR